MQTASRPAFNWLANVGRWLQDGRVDVRVEEVRPPLVPRWPRRRPAAEPSAKHSIAARATEALSVRSVGGFEWGLSIVALFVFGRLAVLFFRRHLSSVFGGPPGALWQDDLAVTLTFAAVEIAVIALAVRRARASALLRQPVLLVLLGWAWLSVAWSVEPATSARRVLLFVGAAGVGWYIGERFSLRDHMRLLAAVGGIAVVTTVVGVIFWNHAATTTNGNARQWSGIYVNRNALGLVLATGLLATVLLIRTTERKWPLRIYAFVLFVFLGRTQSRTAFLAVVASLLVAWITHEVRRRRGSALRSGPAAYVVLATLATLGLILHWYWYDTLRFLGRDPDLTGRTLIWQLVRWFSDLRPWTGWGFEAIWANQRAIGQAQGARGSLREGVPGGWPFSAHNGYYELMLGIGRVGLLLMILFLAVLVWRAFSHAWLGGDVVSLWPLTFVVFALVVNFSESLFVSSEAVWVMVVATSVALAEHSRREGTGVPLRDRLHRLSVFRLV